MRIKKMFLSNLTSHPIAKIGFTVMVFFASVAVVAAWTEPSFSPTDCPSGADGCDSPVNVSSDRPFFFYWDNDDSTLRYLIDTGNMKNLNATFNDVYSPRYYDRNNNFYYTDPASTSRTNRIHSNYIGAGTGN